MSLFWRIFVLNAVALVVAAALLLGPVTVSTPILPGEVLVVVAGLVALLTVNAVVLRIGLAPLGRLGRAMADADLLRPGARAVVSGPVETAELITTYNAMLDRLEAERAASTAGALSAQERERHRIARELHDEVGQTLTAVLLQLKRVADRAPEDLREDLSQAQEATRAGLDEIRRIARRLRPGVLDELGLLSALRSLAAEFTTPGLTVRHDLRTGLPPLTEETELVLYRVAQEALTNTARHSGADRAELRLSPVADGVELLVRDNGRGLDAAAGKGAGIRGMRERALLIGATLSVSSRADGGGVATARGTAGGTDGASAGGTDVRLRAATGADRADATLPAPPGDHG
ncbi:sensor histidine kinase [Streptomyces sp. 3214.6]|uniref:sensor histidine kinase n=1 Tax=Streptomyces sp. 3214.6 TaxID=1882757 RepID=UPI00090A5059|nr:sensor histidine kinase [Streptomyces sp. 3214.6]SHH88169.1 two-component system, NarL family, sensor histidine kinase UhpB [Streptomyces sp. 3214.6]